MASNFPDNSPDSDEDLFAFDTSQIELDYSLSELRKREADLKKQPRRNSSSQKQG